MLTMPESTALFNDPANILRPVDWRWLRAVDLVERAEPASSRFDDADVRLAVEFCRALRNCQDDAGRQVLARRLPAPFEAHLMYTDPPSFWKSVLEARMLTADSFDTIAAKCKVSPDIVRTYEASYFCVRDRLHCKGYVWHQVVQARGGAFGNDLATILKMRAYGGGALFLEALLDVLEDPHVAPERLEQCGPAERKALGTKLLLRASLVLDQLPIDESTLRKLAVLRDAAAVFRRDGLAGSVSSLGQPLTIIQGPLQVSGTPLPRVVGWSTVDAASPAGGATLVWETAVVGTQDGRKLPATCPRAWREADVA